MHDDGKLHIFNLCDGRAGRFCYGYLQLLLVGSYLQDSVQCDVITALQSTGDVTAALQSTSDVTAQAQHQPMDCSEAESVVTRRKIITKRHVNVKQSSESKKQSVTSQTGPKNDKVTSQTSHKRRRVPDNINIGALQNL